MKLSQVDREMLRMKFGGKCAYCGCELAEKGWHADHVEPVHRDGNWIHGKWVLNGDLLKPENDRADNFYPACAKCNILKSNGTPEDLRKALSYFAESIPTIQTYSHVHHLMRFKKLTIETTPVVFWFERYQAKQEAPA
jgi:hypothetical protein